MTDTVPPPVTLADFERIDIRVGTILAAEPFPEARKPAIKLSIDLGPALGVRRSAAQVTAHHAPDTLVGRHVPVVLNLPTRRIGAFASEVLTLGLPDGLGAVTLIAPDATVPNGGRLF